MSLSKATYDIYTLYLGEIEVFEKSAFKFLLDCGVKIKCPFISFVLKSKDKTILVDTGPADPEFVERWHRKILVPEGCDIMSALRNQAGIEPEEIDYIINTHLHWDHCHNNDRFPGKKIYLQKSEYIYAMDPLPFHRYLYETPQWGQFIPAWMRASAQYEFVEGDVAIDDGIELIHLPGHTPGQQGVLVNTVDGEYLLAGDLINLQECWSPVDADPLNKMWRHIMPGSHHSLEDCVASFLKIEKLDAERGGIKVIANHDQFLVDNKILPVRQSI